MPEDITQITAPDGTICNIRDKSLSLLNEQLEDILETGGEPVLISKTITENGTYRALDDNANGYREVTVDVASGGITNIVKMQPVSGTADKYDACDVYACNGTETSMIFGTFKLNTVGSIRDSFSVAFEIVDDFQLSHANWENGLDFKIGTTSSQSPTKFSSGYDVLNKTFTYTSYAATNVSTDTTYYFVAIYSTIE